MKVNRKLNFVVPIEDDAGEVNAYVHAEPIGEACFDRYYMILGQAFSAMHAQGLGLFAGPRVAARLIKSLAQAAGAWEGPEGVERGLFAEIRRLANFIAPGPNGWEPVPLEEAVRRDLISAEDASEVENALAFFTVASWMHRRNELPAILEVVSRIWAAQTSSSNCTAFAASLKTSTATASTGEKDQASRIRL